MTINKVNYYVILSSILFICTCTIPALRTKNKQKCATTPENNAFLRQKPAIILDLINVLFKESYIGFAKKIGYGELTSYALTHWKNPGHRCLDMLHAMSKNTDQQPHIIISLNGRTMPRCIIELQEGKKTCAQAHDEIKNAIVILDQNKFFTSVKEKNLMCSIMKLMLDPTVIAHVTEPIKQMIALAQKLKQNGHSLYLCANIPHEFYAMLQNKYPSIINLFDGIVVSSEIKIAKPNKKIFEHLISTYNLDPQHCILIDNSQENSAAAQTLGIRSIVYEKQSALTSFLKKCGVFI